MIYIACHIMPWHDYNAALMERGSMIYLDFLDSWKEARNEKRNRND
ncbi:MAG: hypothetical protein QW431_02895 [Conexivisphaerales archaeon]